MWQIILYAIYAILAVIGAILGYQLVKLGWEALRQKLRGKRIAVLGEHAVGKTKLIEFLTTGTFSPEYIETAEPTKEAGRKFQLRDLELKIDDIIDFSGGEEWYPLWEQQFKKADIVFYLFKANEYFSGNKQTQNRVHQDLGQIDIWFRENKNHNPIYFLVGTHCDLIPGYSENASKSNARARFNEELLKYPIAKELKLHVDATRIKLGSTLNPENAEELVYRLFHQIEIIMR